MFAQGLYGTPVISTAGVSNIASLIGANDNRYKLASKKRAVEHPLEKTSVLQAYDDAVTTVFKTMDTGLASPDPTVIYGVLPAALKELLDAALAEATDKGDVIKSVPPEVLRTAAISSAKAIYDAGLSILGEAYPAGALSDKILEHAQYTVSG